MEEASFSQLDDNFIVLPSQDETQQSLQPEDKMAAYLKRLPALQGPAAGTSKLGLDAPSDTGEDVKKAKILVPDSEYESGRHTEPSDYVSESEEESADQPGDATSEDHAELTVIQKPSTGDATSEDHTEVTVIQKPSTEADKDKPEGSNPSSESSFQSRNRSNLGSYDQCELFKTQSGHAKGYRFNLFASSQDDMFATDDNQVHGDGQPVSTPAEHLGSLHLSQKPMLVPETIDETGNAISPSPEVYGSTPIIIPSSPTQHSQGYGDEASMFDINAANTLAENSKGFEFGDSSEKESSSGSKGTTTPEPESASIRKSPIDIDEALQMDTFVDEDKGERRSKKEKKNKPSEKHQQADEGEKEGGDRSESPIIVSMDSHRPASRSQDDDVIVIPSGTLETQQEDQSEQLFLHLSPSQDGTTQGQRSQGRLSLGMSAPMDRDSQGRLGHCTSAPIDRESQQQQPETADADATATTVPGETVAKKSEWLHSTKTSQQSERSSQGNKEVAPDGGHGHKKRSQGSGSEGQRSQGHSSGSEKAERSQRRREERQLADINDHPLVVWKDTESDTDQFHLTLPKDGDLIRPADVTLGDESQGQAVTTGSHGDTAEPGTSEEKAPEAGHQGDSHKDSILSEDSHREEPLAIGAIQSESEPVTQPMFRLEKPALADTEETQGHPEDMFVKASPRQVRPHTRYIMEDDSDEEQPGPSSAKQGKEAAAKDLGSVTQKAGQSSVTQETSQCYVAQKLDLVPTVEESVEDTQPYDPTTKDLHQDAAAAPTVDYNSVRDSSAVQTQAKVSALEQTSNTTAAEKSTLVQSSTQTQDAGSQLAMDAGSQVGVDINVVQKVAEYLQSGYSPRSRSSSSCTDISDLQGSEKSEGKLKTPKRRDRHLSSASLSRRDSADRRTSPKSPKEIQDILNTYSSILSKSKSKHAPPSLSREVSVSESLKSFKDNKDGASEASGPTTPVLSRRSSHTEVSGHTTPVLSRKSSHTEVSGHTTPVLSRKSSLTGLSATKPAGSGVKETGESTVISQPGTPRVKPPVRKELIRQYSGTENNGFSPIPEVVSPKPTEKDKVVESSPAVKTKPVTVVTEGATSPMPSASKPTTSKEKTGETAGETAGMRTPSDKIIKQSEKPHSKERHSTRHRVKRRLSSTERSERRRSVDSSSPRLPTGAFVASSQKFSAGSTPTHSSPGTRLHRGDTFEFKGTQSQVSPEEETSRQGLRKPTSSPSYAEKTPLSSRKRSRLATRLKKSKTDAETTQTTPGKPHVSFKNGLDDSHDQPVSQKSDTTGATIGSLQSLPSSISSPPGGRDMILSPSSTSSGSRQSVRSEVSARLAGKRMSIETALPDTIPLPQGDEENYQLVTEETHVVKKVYTEVVTTKRLIGPDGQVLESSVDVQKGEPTIMEESSHKRKRYVFIASPSRSAASLTSGDLADISSSLSRSSVSSGSLGSKGNTINRTTSQSLEAGSYERQISDPQPDSFAKGQGDKAVPMETDQQKDQEMPGPSGATPAGNQHAAVPETERAQSTTPLESAPVTPNMPECSVMVTPLGSTINKTGSSYLHSRTVSMESPKTSDSLFTSPEDRRTRHTSDPESPVKKPSTLPEDPVKTERQTSSSDDVGSEIPHQDQAVSSSSPGGENSLVTSSGVVGCHVIAKWKDGFFYPGTLKSTTDRWGKCQVKFDDGDSMHVKVCDILLIERLPVGQSVMVLTDEGDFECGLISRQQAEHYIVSKDEGGSGRFTHGQVILSADQASCIISDAGSEILLDPLALPGPGAQTGDVSLDNLVDEPRRSAKKSRALKVIPEETPSQPSTSKTRKRKLEELKPKATSTPTPKGKHEMAAKRRKVMDVDESPIETSQSSPLTAARRSPRKARDRLFQKDVGPVPTKKLFRGLTFLLTNVDKSREQREFEQKLLRDSALEVSTDESAVEQEVSAPFDKDHLKAQIEAGGGVFVEALEEKLVGKKKVYLLSSSYQRTIKYLQCLACGMPCVSHMWLVDSCTQDKLLDEKSYILPNGVSLEKRKMMEGRGKKDTFIGVKAAVFSKNTKFVETWSNILTLGKCTVHKQLQYSEVDVIVTDGSCTPAIKRQASSHSVSLVSMEWVIQSLVNNKAMPFDGHLRYKYDFAV